jgi:hypothetical protein
MIDIDKQLTSSGKENEARTGIIQLINMAKLQTGSARSWDRLAMMRAVRSSARILQSSGFPPAIALPPSPSTCASAVPAAEANGDEAAADAWLLLSQPCSLRLATWTELPLVTSRSSERERQMDAAVHARLAMSSSAAAHATAARGLARFAMMAWL